MITTEHRFVAADGLPIFYRRTKPSKTASAGVLVVHGMGEHGGRYAHLAEFLAASGAQVLTPDLRGFGKSGGARGCLRSMEDHHADLSAALDILAGDVPGRPIFILGHSFGGLVSASLVARSPGRRLAGLVLSSPIFGIGVPVPVWRHALGWALSWIVPDYAQSTGVRPEWLTHDPEMLERYGRDALIHHKISCRLYRILTENLSDRARIARRIKVPLLVLQAELDRVVSPDAAVKFFHECPGPDKELEVYAGFYHEILNEVERQRVFARISSWIMAHLTS